VTNIHTGDVLSDIEAAPPPKKTTKTLIVGSAKEGVGDTFAQYLEAIEHEDDGHVYLPSVGSLDVLSSNSLHKYIDHNGPFDRIVYAAGFNQLGWVDDLTHDSFDKHMALNVWGFVDVVRAHRYYWPNNQLNMVVVVSDAAETPMRSSLAYCSSKAAALMAVRCLARECYPSLRIVAVSPGVVSKTPMTESVDKQIQKLRNWTAQEARDYEDKNATVVGRVTKADVCRTIMFALNGPRHLHGTNIKINGGRS